MAPVLRHQKGFSLFEVLIALFVLAVGLLGLAHLQLTTLKNVQSAEFRSQASILAADIFDKMRANQPAARAGNYNFAFDDDAPVAPDTVAEFDLIDWLGAVSTSLPQGSGAIGCPNFNPGADFICQITIRWNETQIGDADTDYGELGQSEFIFSGAI
ncbi:type IV fimbrial biogenesis protein PilV [Methylophaga lonarensis MPL]|uniref:Type IV fimbrial biogenesis protein PilV n=1 Tax=Methylophaga lonarensis MPL TaxID=1286106 RepID=M7NZQ1_9GAMM|nr:type IV pilus modification protein PilV [Methylophaga lonarensis]EMR14303.1 type IV fimbrial biogenesis protein PilV [Methylophaga lonarensis MPL]